MAHKQSINMYAAQFDSNAREAKTKQHFMLWFFLLFGLYLVLFFVSPELISIFYRSKLFME